MSILTGYAVVPAPWHFLYFLPDPQGQGSLRPTLACPRTTCCGALPPFDPAMRACSSSRFLRFWNWASISSTEVDVRRRGAALAAAISLAPPSSDGSGAAAAGGGAD